MSLIIIHKNRVVDSDNGQNLLQLVICGKLPVHISFDHLNGYHMGKKTPLGICGNSWFRGNNSIIALPQEWATKMTKAKSNIIYYGENLPIPPVVIKHLKAHPWLIVSNGRFATHINHQSFHKMLTNLQADVIAVNVLPQMKSAHEKVLVSPQGQLIGFRRFYDDSAQSVPISDDWPHHLFIKTNVLEKLLVNMTLPLVFDKLIHQCSSNSLTFFGLNVGGTVLDLETETGLLSFLTTTLQSMHGDPYYIKKQNRTISANARVFGKVVLGDNVHIAENAVIIGPTILADNVKIAPDAVVKTSVLGPDLSIPKGCLIQNRILIGTKSKRDLSSQHTNIAAQQPNYTSLSFAGNRQANNNFRIWPKFSYARYVKRLADIIASLIVLALFTPIFPIVAIAIKLSSRGPVFFKDKRQGLHGKEFFCLKFRTMVPGAGGIQEKLRFINKVDGPQFKIKNDPRVTVVGIFLRDTFIDEIPQFVNVMLGQMSVVGPRPSPEAENIVCAAWRDARLSVRPGITGLWQIRRTRRPDRDFQEWIYHDIKYVRNLSPRLDLLICWQTAKKLIVNFIDQF